MEGSLINDMKLSETDDNTYHFLYGFCVPGPHCNLSVQDPSKFPPTTPNPYLDRSMPLDFFLTSEIAGHCWEEEKKTTTCLK